MSEIPTVVKDYLVTDDALSRAQIEEQHPKLQAILGAPETRTAILAWLQNDAAWIPSATLLTLNCIEHLRNGANEAEASIVRPFLLHDDRRVRLATYEYLRVLYYPDKNREAMNQLYQNMMMDNDDTIRAQAIRYLKRASAQDDLKTFLRRWYKAAPSRGWEQTESYELLERLLSEPLSE